ncbi:MAG TPA: cyclic nucleotide-binding and patatin-like phospholipase domain-containing protein [Acidimicrobiales bacterium]|nr:cyclic nucleotide-binding and patatin-like phospholipase domain-containing protein [Acidimicrobiales bacterium]
MSGVGRLGRTDVITALRTSEVFCSLGPRQLEALADVFQPVGIQGGEILLRRGEAGDAVYVVVSGRLQVFDDVDGTERTVEEVGAGRLVGEVSLLGGEPRGASVRAVRDSVLLRLPAADFLHVVRTEPDTLLALSHQLVRTLTRHDSGAPHVASPVRTVAILPAGRGPSETAEFAHAMARSLKSLGSVTVVGSRLVDNAVGHHAAARDSGARGEGPLLTFLNGLEQDHDFVVYEADPTPTTWTERCIRQADRMLLVGAADAGPGLSEVEETFVHSRPASARPRCELVIIRSADRRPTGTAAWLAQRPDMTHHHVRRGHGADEQRVARLAVGRAVGLALGGGGPRGFAHLGVMRALEENGVPIDAVAGTSMGAIMAATYAMGWDDETRVAYTLKGFMETKRLIGYTLPLVALSSSRNLTRAMRAPDFFGETAIEDMPVRAAFVSANLTRSRIEVHEQGPAWFALRASASMPGVLPPVWMDGDLLVDGGVVDDLPVGVLRARMEGTVLAVDLEPGVEMGSTPAFDPSVSGWRVLASRLNPFSATMRIPGPVRVMLRAKEIGGRRAQRDRLAADPPDLLFHPPVEAFDALDFSNGLAVVEVGYRHAMDVLAANPVQA